jgi:hypothetical protein
VETRAKAESPLRTATTLLAFAAVLLLAILFPHTGGIRAAEAPDGHQTMLRLLRKIEARTDVENHYLGDAGFQQMQQKLAALPAGAPALDRFRLLVLAGFHALRLGRTSLAIELYMEAYKLLPAVQDEVPAEIRDETILQLAVSYLRLGED